MKATTFLIVLGISLSLRAQQQDVFQPMPLGSIQPTGWLKVQMEKDMRGFVGNLDIIVPELINDPIYGSGRLQKNSKAKDLGNMKAGDAAGDEQYKWWNSETQSNWWDGYIRHAFLIRDSSGMEKARRYVMSILATQDEDGYLGIYDQELRYRFASENGELWSKATLYRGLLAYYEFTKDESVFGAVKNAVENVMRNYPIGASSPFSSGTAFNGGVSHGLTFTDVLERMYYHTREEKYRAYALFLYKDFSQTYQSEGDAQLKNILDPGYKLWSHGVHTFEHIRAVIIARYASSEKELDQALETYLGRVRKATTISGGAIGDEWIAGREADASHTGYEYCSLQELLDSYSLLMQKTGTGSMGDAVENIFYNAAQGSRNPNHSCIAYLKTDNSYEMLGTKNGEIEPDRKQTRYKYSAAHQDVAVCCNPNAGRISPYFVQNSWMKENDTTLVAALLMPNVVETAVKGSKVVVENKTGYPYQNTLSFRIRVEKPISFTIKIRKPGWVTGVVTKENYRQEGDFLVIHRVFSSTDEVNVSLESKIQVGKDGKGERYYSFGALLYAKPIEARELRGRVYANQFADLTYEPIQLTHYSFYDAHQSVYKDGVIRTQLINAKTGKLEKVELVPFGKTILRQVTFK
ncbi:MAG: glycoside hydrolase family 127 protein [Cyclobacteriaceae bacterium]|nr:glycoside hydrolase family 127 protein [Cyclobacteriaceae bacterium]